MPVFSESYKRYVLGTLTFVYTLNLLDRGLITLLLQPIKEDLHLSDTKLGFLTGIAFGLFYATLGLPMARWADRGNRTTITSLAIALWGVTVMACLLVSSYTQLVFARIAAAVGESGCKPPTYSLIGDYFPEPGERTRALAVYIAGNSLASLISFILGGWLNERYGWRTAFFLIGVPGLILAAVVKLTVREPRTQVASANVYQRASPSIRTVLRALWNQRSFRHLSIALILLYSMGLGLGPWYAAFMMRSHGMGTGELGVWMGTIFGVSGITGVLLGGYVANRWFMNNEPGQMRMSAFAVTLIVPCFIAFLTLPQKHAALMALVPLVMVLSIFLGPTYALMQRLVTDEMRATTMAIVMLLANLIGMGVGPQIVGVLSDLLRPTFGTDSLRWAMLTMSLLAFWGSYHFWRVGRTVKEDLAAVAGGDQFSVRSTAIRGELRVAASPN
jgi:predicted MFS family arabinose efflux permease